MSGFAFGLIIGYLSWYAFRPGETPETVPIQKIGALLAIVSGATVLALFPAGTALFEYYGLGLAVGFFFTPLGKWLGAVLQILSNFIKKIAIARKSKHKKELETIEEDWLKVERLVRHKLDTSTKLDELAPHSNYIDITDLQELQYSHPAVEYIMRRYAQLYVRDGVEYTTWSGRPILLRKRW
jgi:hypothetical protein